MKIDTLKALENLNGDPLRFPIAGPSGDPTGEFVPFTVKTACVNALISPLKGDENLTGDFKMRCFLLAMKINQNDEVDLSAEDVVLIKSRVGAAFDAVVVGRLYSILDPNSL